MPPEEFLHRTRAAERELHRTLGFQFAGLGILITASLALVFSPWWVQGKLPWWIILSFFVVFFGALFSLALYQAPYTRRVSRKHGLCCLKCGQPLTGSAGIAALSAGTCVGCGVRVIDPPPSPMPSLAGDGGRGEAATELHPPGKVLLDRRGVPAKLAKAAAGPLGALWIQIAFVMPGVALFNNWSLHGLSTRVFIGASVTLLAGFALLCRLHHRRLRQRHIRSGLCCPQCREPLYPEQRALETLATCHCARCGAAVFAPGPL